MADIDRKEFHKMVIGEALSGFKPSTSLSGQLRDSLVDGISEMFLELESRVSGRWNQFRVATGGKELIVDSTSESIHINDLGSEALRSQLLGEGFTARSTTLLLRSTIIRTLFMFQAGVTSVEELDSLRAKSRKHVDVPGRQSHSNVMVPPGAIKTSLHRINYREHTWTD